MSGTALAVNISAPISLQEIGDLLGLDVRLTRDTPKGDRVYFQEAIGHILVSQWVGRRAPDVAPFRSDWKFQIWFEPIGSWEPICNLVALNLGDEIYNLYDDCEILAWYTTRRIFFHSKNGVVRINREYKWSLVPQYYTGRIAQTPLKFT